MHVFEQRCINGRGNVVTSKVGERRNGCNGAGVLTATRHPSWCGKTMFTGVDDGIVDGP